MEIVGIDSDKVLQISKKKKEDEWVQKFRLDSYEKFEKLGMPEFGPEVDLDFSKIILLFQHLKQCRYWQMS